MSEPNDDDFVVEHTLGQYREVSAYKIPPRPSAGGKRVVGCFKHCLILSYKCARPTCEHHGPVCGLCQNILIIFMYSAGYKSGDWRIEDRIFTGRMALVDCGKTAELRLTDAST